MTRLALFVIAVSALPPDSAEYAPAEHTQSIFTLNERPAIRVVKIADLDQKWHRSGGMSKDTVFTSRKFKNAKAVPVYEIALLPVLNSSGHYQYERGIYRVYPDGSRFDDMLFNEDGVLFEHRVREKKKGRWFTRVESKAPRDRPVGYTGLTQSCASCHDAAGTGGYGSGLVPGGDTVLSDPLDWDKAKPYLR